MAFQTNPNIPKELKQVTITAVWFSGGGGRGWGWGGEGGGGGVGGGWGVGVGVGVGVGGGGWHGGGGFGYKQISSLVFDLQPKFYYINHSF